MNLPASQLDEAVRPRAAALKFAYPSGSRPLEGYTIKRGVGRGGFGEVYFATSDAGKEVALKLIRRNLEVELRGVTQCLNLKHPNLVGLFDIRTDSMDDQWVIMEYVSGESLEDVIDRHPNGMPVDQVLWWMRGMCAGVAYLHDHGIVHRDLKPGNIFCDEGTVKIGDYGLAKFISCSRRSGQTESVGTVHYMAPEIANGRYGREIDTYALGIILFEMLTGTVPFEGESVGEVLMKHLTAEPDLHRLEEPYRDIVQRALAKDPDARIKGVGEMLALLPGEPGEVAYVAAQPGPTEQAREYRHIPPFSAAKAASPHAPASPADDIEEPIWKAIRETWANFRRRWDGEGVQRMNPLAKGLTVFALVVGALWFFSEAMVLAIPALICYGVYYSIWVMFIRPGMRRHASRPNEAASAGALHGRRTSQADVLTAAWHPSTDVKPAVTAAERYAESRRRRRLRPSWRERANRELAAKPFRDKLSELLGSMILASLVAMLASMVAPLLLGIESTSEGLVTFYWLALVGTLGSWAIMVPTKFVEGKIEDQVPMRMMLLLLGAAVGVAAWGLAEVLIVQMPTATEPIGSNWGLISHEMLRWSRPQQGVNPPLAAYVTYFAFLFVLLRWWRQAEFARGARLSLWSVLVCVFWAWLLQMFWWFPQPAGMLVAAVIAFATQLSSPWLPPSRRRALSAEVEQAV